MITVSEKYATIWHQGPRHQGGKGEVMTERGEIVPRLKHWIDVRGSKGSAKLGRIKLEEIEEALGK